MKLQRFEGGLATRLDPQFLQVNQGVVYTNIDNSKGSLTPVKTKLATNIEAYPFNFYAPSIARWVGNVNKTYWAEFDNKTYSFDGITSPVTRSVSEAYISGIASPTEFIATAQIQSAVVTDVTFEVEASASPLALPNQDTTYLLINRNEGVFSSPLEITVYSTNLPTTKTKLGSGFSRGVKRVVTSASNSDKKTINLIDPRALEIGNEGIWVFRQFKDVWRRVGVFTSFTSTVLDHTEDISSSMALDETEFSPLKGTYQYVITYYDAVRGRESGPSPVSAEVNLTDSGVVNLSAMPNSSNPNVTHKRIYRVGGDVTTFTLVAQVSNIQMTYVDSIKDLDLQDTVTLTTDIDLPPYPALNYGVEANGMLFAADNAQLRYTPIGKPESWPEFYYITFASKITGLAAVFSGILVCTIDQTYLVSGSGPNSLITTPISGDIGCIAPQSMQVHKGAAFFVSAEGICVSAGDNIRVLSKDLLGTLRLNPVDSIVADECYYVLDSSGELYCLDLGLGGIYKKFAVGVTSLGKQGSEVYGYASGVLYKLFKGTGNEQLSYKSPRFIEGAFTRQKTYKNIYIYSKGDIIVKVYINDELVTTENLTTEDSHKIEVPQRELRGFYIQFEITGTGTVYEIEYEVGNPV